MKTTNIINKLGLVVIIFMVTGMFNSVLAQDKYSFAMTKGKYSEKENTVYYFVSDPVKNWNNFSEQEQKDFNIEFKASAKRQTGEDLVTEYRVGFFRGPTYYNSLTEAKQGIEKWIEDTIKAMTISGGREVKVIRINLYKYR